MWFFLKQFGDLLQIKTYNQGRVSVRFQQTGIDKTPKGTTQVCQMSARVTLVYTDDIDDHEEQGDVFQSYAAQEKQGQLIIRNINGNGNKYGEDGSRSSQRQGKVNHAFKTGKILKEMI